MKIRIFPLLFIALLISVLSACNKTEYRRCEGFVWNTLYHITYRGASEMEDSIMQTLDQVSKSLSIFDSASLVSKINAGERVLVDNKFMEVYEMSKRIHKESHGMFDPTVSPLITAWGFGPGHRPTADTVAVDSILKFVGLDKTRLIDGVLIKDDPRIQFNFSAIAKGYGCDAVGEMFRRNGITDFMIEIGGEITLSGKSPSGQEWKISIDAPLEESEAPSHESFTILSLSDCGIATSGNYRNFRKESGKRLAHTISPVTGYPLENEILSATIVAPNCMEADAIATACMASGADMSKKMVENLGVQALLIFNDSVWMTPGFRNLIIEEASEPGKTIRN